MCSAFFLCFLCEWLSLYPPSFQLRVHCLVGVGQMPILYCCTWSLVRVLETWFWRVYLSGRVRHLTVEADQLVHATLPVFALGVVFLCEVFSDCVVCCECNCYVRVFKYFSDVTGFLPDIREPCPFFLLCMCVEVLSKSNRIFETVLKHDPKMTTQHQ